MINNTETLKLTGLTAIEAATVRKEVGESIFLFDCKIEKENGAETYKALITGVEDELATLSLPQQTATAAPDPVVDAILVDEEDESSLSVSDVKNVIIGGAVGATKIGFKSVGGIVEIAGAAGGRAALAGSNTAVRTAKAVADRISEDREWAEAKANVDTLLSFGKTKLGKFGKKFGKMLKNAAKD